MTDCDHDKTACACCHLFMVRLKISQEKNTLQHVKNESNGCKRCGESRGTDTGSEGDMSNTYPVSAMTSSLGDCCFVSLWLFAGTSGNPVTW